MSSLPATSGSVDDAPASTPQPETLEHSGSSLTRVPHILFGADYNPEQWPDDILDEDVEAMVEAGVNLVSVGIFSWALIEPQRGEYQFDWLDRVIGRLHTGGIGVDLATPTASPPAWLAAEHPEILPLDADGHRLWHGSRRHYCPHSAAYRERAVAVAEALARRYGEHPALALWHVDNEYACHVTECFCDTSSAAFRDWLRERYGEVGAVNDAWATTFWGQRYGAWEELGPPRRTPAFVNPGQLLDWRRFCSDSWLACFDDQAAVLRRLTPAIPITTNFMHFHPPLDYWTWAQHEDVVSDDFYPDTSAADWMVEAAMVSDLMRSLGAGRPWMRMEQATAQVNWRPRNPTKRPGVMRRGCYQAIARGAEGVLFFQWRASQGGSERFHSAMLPAAGKDTRTWREVVALGAELARLDELLGSSVRAEVALLYDWENVWALEAPGLPSVDVATPIELRAWYAAFYRRGVLVDLAHPASDLSRYRLVVLPGLHLVSDEAVARVHEVVERGGTVVMTYFSGIADAADRIRPGGYPGAFRDLIGLTVEEVAPFLEGGAGRVQAVRDGATGSGEVFGCSVWADVIRPEGAESIATFLDDYYAGRPAVTRHRAGRGDAWYVGTHLEADGLDWLLGLLCEPSGLDATSTDGAAVEPQPGVEVVTRRDGARAWTFALNHGDAAVELSLRRPGRELLSGEAVAGSVHLPAGEVAIIRTD